MTVIALTSERECSSVSPARDNTLRHASRHVQGTYQDICCSALLGPRNAGSSASRQRTPKERPQQHGVATSNPRPLHPAHIKAHIVPATPADRFSLHRLLYTPPVALYPLLRNTFVMKGSSGAPRRSRRSSSGSSTLMSYQLVASYGDRWRAISVP